MTQQTLREELYSLLDEIDENGDWSERTPLEKQRLTEDFLAHFKEFAETMIGRDEPHKTQDGMHPYGCEGCIKVDARNALRNEQRKILAEKLK